MTAFGLSPLGEELGPFGGPGLITLLGVLPLSRNSFVMVFDREPCARDNQSPFSSVNVDNYELTAIDPTITAGNGDIVIPDGSTVPTYQPRVAGAYVDDLDPKQVVITTDSQLEPGVVYQASVNAQIKTSAGEVFAGPTTFSFVGRRLPQVPVGIEVYEERYRDFDYVLESDTANPNRTQVYRFDDSGDIGLQNNAASLQKRLFRRVTTQPGGFAFFPSYGAGLQIKKLAKSGRMQELANTIAEQVKQEPDVLNAGAATKLRRTETGAFVLVSLQVVQNDARERKFYFEFPVSD